MASTSNTTTTTSRVAAVTGFAIPVSKWRKLTGEPVPGANGTDYLVVPVGAAARYPADKWSSWGGVKTYRFWTPASSKVPPTHMVSSPKPDKASNQGPPSDNRGYFRDSSGTRDPCGRRDPLPCLRDLQRESEATALGLQRIGCSPKRESCERAERPAKRMHHELLELLSEGGSGSASGGSTSDSEEVEECSVHGSDHSLCDNECRSRDGFLILDSPSGSSSEGGQHPEESNDVEEQENSSSSSCAELD